MNDKDNIILFPTDRIKNKHTVKHPVDEKAHQKLVEKQTKDAMTLLGHEKGVLNELRLYEGDRRTKLDRAVDKIKGLLN